MERDLQEKGHKLFYIQHNTNTLETISIPVASMGSTKSTRDPSGSLSGNLYRRNSYQNSIYNDNNVH